MNKWRLKWHRIMHWEYWPMEAVYYPMFLPWLYYAIKARSFFFFNAANPSIKNGGMAMESKKEIYDIIPAQYIPKTLLVNQERDMTAVLKEVQAMDIGYPLFAKPDIGMKAFGVSKIKNEKEKKKNENEIKNQSDFFF